MTDDAAPQAPPSFALAGERGEWIASRYADVQAILSDERFGVAEAPPGGAAGTLSWLRASVSRFVNGQEHHRRRARVVAELSRLEPGELGRAAHQRARAVLADAGAGGARIDVMSLLARRIPAEVMAGRLGAGDPQAAASAVIEIAAAYFPGAGEPAQRRADQATARLAGLLGPGETDTTVARITLLVQGCDATAGLIGSALCLLRDTQQAGAGGRAGALLTRALLTEVLGQLPPVRVIRRVTLTAAQADGCPVPAGAAVVCDIEAANLDPAASGRPGAPGSRGQAPPSLTFGYGIRPCPGEPQALALAAGVVDAVRECCVFRGPRQAEYEPSPLRIPRQVEVALR